MSEIRRCRRGKKSGKEVEGEREREARQPMGHETWDMGHGWTMDGHGGRGEDGQASQLDQLPAVSGCVCLFEPNK